MIVRVAVVLVRLVTVREGGEGCAVCVCGSDKYTELTINEDIPLIRTGSLK